MCLSSRGLAAGEGGNLIRVAFLDTVRSGSIALDDADGDAAALPMPWSDGRVRTLDGTLAGLAFQRRPALPTRTEQRMTRALGATGAAHCRRR